MAGPDQPCLCASPRGDGLREDKQLTEGLSTSGREGPPRVFSFTDLDGTLLDQNQSFAPAQPALEACRQTGVGLILVSSKTRAEIDVLRRRLGLVAPFIAENGGAIYFPREVSPRLRSRLPRRGRAGSGPSAPLMAACAQSCVPCAGGSS